ncbi:alcaligin biosynthesis protein, partial [Pseudoalteromonas sp. S185]|uniref:ferric iron reductase n=1 Tax=Pseudoalteromonas sp. S185 TaxID=2066522 RepID=UPI0011099885
VREALITEHVSWQGVAKRVNAYQQAKPALNERFKEYDLLSDEFADSCLNRVQRGNNKQRVDLPDPAWRLQFAGNVDNQVSAKLNG